MEQPNAARRSRTPKSRASNGRSSCPNLTGAKGSLTSKRTIRVTVLLSDSATTWSRELLSAIHPANSVNSSSSSGVTPFGVSSGSVHSRVPASPSRTSAYATSVPNTRSETSGWKRRESWSCGWSLSSSQRVELLSASRKRSPAQSATSMKPPSASSDPRSCQSEPLVRRISARSRSIPAGSNSCCRAIHSSPSWNTRFSSGNAAIPVPNEVWSISTTASRSPTSHQLSAEPPASVTRTTNSSPARSDSSTTPASGVRSRTCKLAGSRRSTSASPSAASPVEIANTSSWNEW